MVKKILIIVGVTFLILAGGIVTTIMLYSPKNSMAYTPEIEIKANNTNPKPKPSNKRLDVLKDGKKRTTRTAKQIAPVFNLDIISEKPDTVKPNAITNPVDSNSVASIDTIAIYEAILKQKKESIASNRVGAKGIPKPKRYQSAATTKPVHRYTAKPKPMPKPLRYQSAEETAKVADQQVQQQPQKTEAIRKEKYEFNFISSPTKNKNVDQTNFVRAELAQNLKIRSGSESCEIVLLENCNINGKDYMIGDIMHGFSRLSGDRLDINISKITSNESGSTEFVNLTVFDTDFQQGIIIDQQANQQKKRIIRNTSRDLIPNSLPGANTARGLINTIASGANGKVEKGYVIHIEISAKNSVNNF